MHTPNLDMLLSEFKTTAETRACIVLNGMGRKNPPPADFIAAAMSCALNDTHIGPAENADWRLFIVELGEGYSDDNLPEPTPKIHLPRWLVDTVNYFVTDDELDTIIGETGCREWVKNLGDFADALPAELRRDETVALCRQLEAAADTLPPDREAWIDACLRLKVAVVREARKEPPKEPEADTVVVAIIGDK